MIEIVCKDRLQEEEGKVCLPQNIRQIGSPRGRHKIYIEDYVYTYLKSMAQKKESCAAVFLGKGQVIKDIRYTFVSGAIECGSGVFQWDSICLDDGFWRFIEEEKKQYFPDKEIVGWFLGKTGQAMELTSVVEAAHRKYFSGRDKVLMLMDILEEEEVFFIYDQGYLQKREGYYIYYEKNLPMQEYMIQKRGESSSEERPQTEESKKQETSVQREDWQEAPGRVELVSQSQEPGQDNPEDRKQQETGSGAGKYSEEKPGSQAGKHSEEKPGSQAGKHSEARPGGGTGRNSEAKPGGQAGKHSEARPGGEPGRNSEAKPGGQAGKHSEAKPGGEPGRNSEAKQGSETRADQERQAEFRELHKELERETVAGNQEKIFAKSNLEEPKTQAEEAMESYRHMILERQGRQIERQNRRFLYTASSFFLVAVCVLGITTINNYRKMQEVEDVLHVMNHKESQENPSQEEGPVVESVMSQVDPLEKDGGIPSSAEAEQGTDKPSESAGETSQPAGASSEGTGQAGENAGGTSQPAGASSEGTDKPSENAGGTGQPAGASSEGTGQPGENAGAASQPAGASSEGTDNPLENAGETSQPAGASSEGTGQPGENAGADSGSQETAETSSAQSQETRYYTVKPGDTLGSICISVYHDQRMMAKVCEANGIENGDKIYVGQRLLLP